MTIIRDTWVLDRVLQAEALTADGQHVSPKTASGPHRFVDCRLPPWQGSKHAIASRPMSPKGNCTHPSLDRGISPINVSKRKT